MSIRVFSTTTLRILVLPLVLDELHQSSHSVIRHLTDFATSTIISLLAFLHVLFPPERVLILADIGGVVRELAPVLLGALKRFLVVEDAYGLAHVSHRGQLSSFSRCSAQYVHFGGTFRVLGRR